MSGTSMASSSPRGPRGGRVPGGHPDAAPAAVATALTGAATADRTGNPGTGTPDKPLKITE
ncbi:hypothetical protein AB0941_11930 [Streptomyces sp. NPDC013433]|uniref:hypothetical protein n=1 Tax=Streptomyces sp. NPDC013433 TaxID=3155604 RepID=UPI00345550F0